jgi:hypothetical protein
MQEKIGSWSLVVIKSCDQENYLSQLLVTSIKTQVRHLDRIVKVGNVCTLTCEWSMPASMGFLQSRKQYITLQGP